MQRDKTSIVINQNQQEVVDVAEFMTITNCVQIDTTHLLGAVRKVYHIGDDVVIWSAEGIVHYDVNGCYINDIGRKGRGPEEYVFVTDVCADAKHVVVYDQTGKIMLFGLDGTYVNSVPATYIVGNTCIHQGKLYASTGYQDKVEKYHVYDLPDLNLLSSFVEVPESDLAYRHFMFQNNFFVKGRELLYHSTMCNDVYTVGESDQELKYSFDFWGKSPSDVFWGKPYKNVAEVVMALTEQEAVYGLGKYATDGKRHFMSYSEPGAYKVAYYNAAKSESVQSANIKFGQHSVSMPFAEVSVTCNSTEDISFVFPCGYADKFRGGDNDNPVLLFARFK